MWGGGEAGVDSAAGAAAGQGFLRPPLLALRCVLCLSHILTPRRKVSWCLINRCIPDTSKVPHTQNTRDSKGSNFFEGCQKD